MAFIRAAWRFLLGVKDVLVLGFLLIFFGVLYAALTFSSGERPVKTSKGALLLDLDGVIVEQPQVADPFAALLSNEAPVKEYRLRDVVMALEAARNDPNVKAVVLNLDGFMGGGQVALSRVGAALDNLRAAKKPVLSYATIYTDDGYQLAAHGSEVWLNPLGAVDIAGPGGSQLYYKGLIDKLGITANIYRVGTYKSAVEPFMRTDQSPEAKAASRALADMLWNNWREEVTKSRPQAAIAAYSADPVAVAEAAKGDLAAAALTSKLVDKTGSERLFDEHVSKIVGDSVNDDGISYAAIQFTDYVRAKSPANHGQIGVLTVAGTIVDGEASPGTAGGDSIADQLEKTLDEKNLKALVLRIDSPGGSVMASERIRNAVLAAKAKGLPVVTSMGNVAASGGYWVSTASDHVFAEPSTITGSIGVFGILPSFEGTLAKIGITSDGVKTTPLSGEPDMLGGISPEFNRISQLGVEDIYRRFLGYVAKARNMTPEKVDGIAQGRVWDGGTARQLGLVDQFGGLEDAIAAAAKLAKLDPAKVRPYYIEPEPDKFMQFIAGLMRRDAKASVGGQDLFGKRSARQHMQIMQAVADARLLVEGASIQAACLECRAFGAPVSRISDKTASDRNMLSWLMALAR
tara:strand:+ start:967 stop:2862 length:1896 start_codon:yes stop_codon:yes gene_type:complete